MEKLINLIQFGHKIKYKVVFLGWIKKSKPRFLSNLLSNLFETLFTVKALTTEKGNVCLLWSSIKSKQFFLKINFQNITLQSNYNSKSNLLNHFLHNHSSKDSKRQEQNILTFEIVCVVAKILGAVAESSSQTKISASCTLVSLGKRVTTASYKGP